MSPRIVSLVPAATEWLVSFGAAELICGTDAPHDRVEAPVVARAGFAGSRAGSAVSTGEPVARRIESDLTADTLRRVAPDLVIVDGVDELWPPDLAVRLASLTGRAVDVFPWQPRSLRDMFEHVLRLGRRIDRLAGAMKMLGDGELRLRASHARTGVNRRAAPETLPGMVVLAGSDPWTVAGRWTSELVDRAAGHALLTESRSPARVVTREEILRAAPELVLSLVPLAPGTFDSIRTVHYPRLELFERAGPGLYDAIVALTAILYGMHESVRIP